MSTQKIPADETPPSNRRGRPKKSEGEVASTKKAIIQATRAVFSEHGSQAITVAKIIKSAGISRPTFYKYFTCIDEPLNAVIEQANKHLVEQAVINAEGTDSLISLVVSVLDTYFLWGMKENDIIVSLHQDLLTPSSIVSLHRTKTIDSLHAIICDSLCWAQSSPPDKVLFESLVMAGETWVITC